MLANNPAILADIQGGFIEMVGFDRSDSKPELQLLVLSLRLRRDSETRERIRSLLNSDLNWDYFIELAKQHAAIPLVYDAISEFCDSMSQALYCNLRHLVQNNSLHSLHLTSELIRLVELLESNNIRALPYKGPVAAEFIYGDLSLRQFSDLDILVSKNDVLKIKELFASIGYFPVNPRTEEQILNYINSGQPYNYKFLSANGIVLVELHWKFTSKHNSFFLDYDLVMDGLVSIEIANKMIPSLNVEDMLVVLCQHGSKHFWTRLLWIRDVATLIDRNPALNWEYVISLSARAGAKRMLFLGLHLSQTLLNAALPDDVVRLIGADTKVKKLAMRIIRQIRASPDEAIEGYEAHLFSCEMRERWRDKARYSGYHSAAAIAKNRYIRSLKNLRDE